MSVASLFHEKGIHIGALWIPLASSPSLTRVLDAAGGSNLPRTVGVNSVIAEVKQMCEHN